MKTLAQRRCRRSDRGCYHGIAATRTAAQFISTAPGPGRRGIAARKGGLPRVCQQPVDRAHDSRPMKGGVVEQGQEGGTKRSSIGESERYGQRPRKSDTDIVIYTQGSGTEGKGSGKDRQHRDNERHKR